MALPESGRAGVYIIRNLLDGKRYIGSSITLRARLLTHFRDLRHGKHCNLHLQRAWDCDGEGAFECAVLEYVENATIPLVRAREQHYLDTLKPEYNMHVDAAKGGKGYKQRPEVVERLRAMLKGRAVAPETRAKIAATLKGRKLAPHVRQILLDCHTGKPRTEETKARISAAHKGIPLSEKHVHGIRKAAKTRKRKERTPEEWAQIGRNISAAKRAKMTPEKCKRISEGKKRAMTPEIKARIGAGNKAAAARRRQAKEARQGQTLWD